MPFQFSFSTSAAVVTSASVNGRETTKGVAYKREQYSNQHGTGVRTTKQRLGEDPVVKTKMFDADGRPLLIVDGSGTQDRRSRSGSRRRRTDQDNSVDTERRIEDVTGQDDDDDDDVQFLGERKVDRKRMGESGSRTG
ncbi:hypothetical protein V8F06_009286 [Rhypophila decipiens]